VARLIAATATSESIPLLIKLDGSQDTRDAAVAGLVRVAPPGLLVTLAKSHTNASQRRQLITALLALNPPEMAGGYLELVRDPATSKDALACLDEARPPTDVFFARLDDPHVSTREAAASVLGRIDGPQTTARLVGMARRNRNRREVLMALADSRGPEARQFLMTNQTSGPLAGPIRSALLQQAQNQ
jgi:HEAT repeat protein